MLLMGPSAVLGTTTYADYVLRHAMACRQLGSQAKSHSETLVAYVNDGRWVGDCPVCNSGMSLHRDWPDGRCLGCGAIFVSVRWPDKFDGIEDELAKRPKLNQNWLPHESIEDLQAEFNEALVRQMRDALARKKR
jgi:hypothetical protein